MVAGVHERALRRAAGGVDELEAARLHASLRDRLFGDGRPAEVGGRYVVGERIGAGGMGVVYRARDRMLGRDVALKIVNRAALGLEGTAGTRSRLRAEARALARLSDPHVVEVFDVREEHGALFVAMELCPGVELGRWLREAPRSVREILDVFVEAGRGLAAAHRAGIVHRDFKPTNVMVGESPRGAGTLARVRVLDFGLARVVDQGDTPSATSDREHADADATRSTTGPIMGTPAYMAPEQHRGLRPTEAADQYAFCLSLWEALVGERPFAGPSLAMLASAKFRGPPPWPRSVRLPGAIVGAIARGLAPTPADRWPSIDELLRVLARRRRVWPLYAGGALGVVALGAAVAMPQAASTCGDADAQLRDVWDPARRAEAEAAMVAVGRDWADGAWARAGGELDGYASAWAQQFAETCKATTVRGDQTAEALDLRMGCLRRARTKLQAVTAAFARADVDIARNTDAILRGLPPLPRCADVDALRRGFEPPAAEDAVAVEHVRASIAAAEVEAEAGRYDAARVLVDEAKAELAAVGYEPARAELTVLDGRLLSAVGEFEEAAARYREALADATRWGQTDEMQRAARLSMSVLGNRLGRYDEALRYLTLAEGLAGGDPLRLAWVYNVHGKLLAGQGAHAEAEARLREAIDLGAQALGADDPQIAGLRTDLAATLNARGKSDEAIEQLERGLAVQLQVLGPQHPDVGASRAGLARALAATGDAADAEAEYRRAIAVLDEALGPAHPNLGVARADLGGLLLSLDRSAEAEQELRRALEIQLAAYGSEHRRVLEARVGLASALAQRGALDEAEAQLRAALQTCEILLGPEHPHASGVHNNLGHVHERRGDLEGALAEYQRALEIAEATLGPTHPRTTVIRTNVTHIRTALDRGS